MLAGGKSSYDLPECVDRIYRDTARAAAEAIPDGASQQALVGFLLHVGLFCRQYTLGVTASKSMDPVDAVIIFLIILLVVGAAMWGPVLIGREKAPRSASGSSSSGGLPSASGGKESYGPPPGNRPAPPVLKELEGGLYRNQPPRFIHEPCDDEWGGLVVDTDGGAVVAQGALPTHTAVTRTPAVGPGGISTWKGQGRSASSMLHAMERS